MNYKIQIIIGLLLIFLNSHSVPAQSATDIEHIRKIYYRTTADISESRKKKTEGPLYCTQSEINRYGKSWRAVGTYNVKTEYWFTDDPSFLADIDEDIKPEHTLAMVIVREVGAAKERYSEYLYEKGQIVFVFIKEGDTQANEHRYYCKNGKIIKTIPDASKNTQRIADIQESARGHLDTFLHIMK